MHSPLVHLAVAAAAVGITASALHLSAVPARGHQAIAADTGAIPVLEIGATDHAYHMADTIAAGPVRVRFTNRGAERHIALVARVPAGRKAADVLASLATDRSAIATLEFVGGPTLPGSSGASELLLDLAPGEYVLVCPVSSPADRVPHMAKGMTRVLTVVPRDGRPARLPAADVRLALVDYGYEFTPMPGAGRHVFAVENRAAQPHEVTLLRLAPGKHVADVLAWASGKVTGPPPADPVGGVTALSRGHTATFEATLAPGDYALLCYVPDAKDGKPHIAHGMTREFTVR